MVLLPPSPAQRAQWSGSGAAAKSTAAATAAAAKSDKGRDKRLRKKREILDRAVESVLNLVEMAGEEGVAEISVYEATGRSTVYKGGCRS
jgi:hypothetical protein